jgi:hypothetical protein
MDQSLYPFAVACYDTCTLVELEAALYCGSFSDDCIAWEISPEQWHEQVQMAIDAKRADAE